VKLFITGTAGFIGFHLAKLLLEEGLTVAGYDGLTDYYDVQLKRDRHDILKKFPRFTPVEAMLENEKALNNAIEAAAPDVIIHLAAQAGVRYSLENPRAFIDANIIGTFNVMECARQHTVKHLLMASTSSVYGANDEMPYAEAHKADTPMSFYAATKKATEAMGHAYAHLHRIPITMFRFFTVYGPWGRPDMALFKFTKSILSGQPIDIFNHGNMWRDFTYIDDLVHAVRLLIDAPPTPPGFDAHVVEGDNLSAVAPFRIVNIGNSNRVRLLDFVDALERRIGRPAIRNYLPMQAGDVPATWADARLIRRLTGYQPHTNLEVGVDRFVTWFNDYYSSHAPLSDTPDGRV